MSFPLFVQASGEVSFSEINWAGSEASSADEWLELYNSSPNVIDLTGWRVVDLVKEKTLLTVESGQVAPGGHFLIANNSQEHEFSNGISSLNTDPDIVDSNLSLSNTKFKLGLFNDSGQLIDEVGNGKSPTAGNKVDFISMERLGDQWVDSQSSINLKSGLGSPTNSGRPQVLEFSCQLIFYKSLWRELFIPVHEYPDNAITKVLINNEEQELDLVDGQLKLRPDKTFENLKIELVASNGLSDIKLNHCPIVELSEQLALNEVFPNPESGQSEFVEIYNSSSRPVSLDGWYLDDLVTSGSKPFNLNGIVIDPRSYKVVELNELKLNNSGDDVNLIDPLGSVVDTVSFPSSSRGLSWSLYKGIWGWSQPTPKQVNVPSQKGSSDLVNQISKSDIFTVLSDSSKKVFKIQVNVVEPLGRYSRDNLIVEGQGLYAELHGKDLAYLQPGQQISVCVKRSSSEKPRLLQQKVCPVEIVGNQKALPVTLSSLDQVSLLMKVELSGRLVRSDRRIWLENDLGRWQITKKSGVSLPKIDNNDEARLVGIIVGLDPTKVRILSEEDFNLLANNQPASSQEIEMHTVPVVSEIKPNSTNFGSTAEKVFGLIESVAQLQDDTDLIGARVLGEKDIKPDNKILTLVVVLSSILSLVVLLEFLWQKLSTKQKAYIN